MRNVVVHSRARRRFDRSRLACSPNRFLSTLTWSTVKRRESCITATAKSYDRGLLLSNSIR